MSTSWWDDFSNNLATDLAPLVALLGESPTKQYLSECLTLEDVIIFAMGPMGIITAIVSAIRVCGGPSLRAFIGRAQEGAGAAEAELCSSTSPDVCELYNNNGIARIFGRPKLLEIIHNPEPDGKEFFSAKRVEATAGLYSSKEYIGKNRHPWTEPKKVAWWDRRSRDSQTTTNFAPSPNLSLNIGIESRGRIWFTTVAVLGALLQSAVLVWAALARYYYLWIRESQEDEYAIPLTVVGTVLLCLGMGLCAYLIENKTGERIYRRAAGKDAFRMYWIQPGNQRVGDQVFESFAYTDEKYPLQRYITSWKKTDKSIPRTCWIRTAVATTTAGFFCQFLGLRACHPSVAVAQFIVTIFMSLIRAGLRTRRLKREDNVMERYPAFIEGHELDFLAFRLGHGIFGIPPEPCYWTNKDSRHLWMVSSISENGQLETDTPAANTPPDPRENEDDKSKALQKLNVENSSILSGFRINPEASYRSEPCLVSTAKKEISQWIEERYRMDQDHPQGQKTTVPLNAAVKTFLYRSRLAHLTGLEAPKSDDSDCWGGKFVAVRDAALILALAIEDTMEILFAPDSQPPVKLYEPWDKAVRIFWTARCSLWNPPIQKESQGNSIRMSLDPQKEFQSNSIHMSLEKAIGQGGPEGPWRADRSELEALLSLWVWSLKEPSEIEGAKETDSKRAGPSISRILAIQEDAKDESSERLNLEIWREQGRKRIQKRRLQVDANCGRSGNRSELRALDWVEVENAVWWKDDGKFIVRNGGQPQGSRNQRRFFGWHSVKKTWPCRELAVLETTSKSSLVLNCAQEIYSTFLTAILKIVGDFGSTTVRQHEEGLTATNDNIERIRNALELRGLCDTDESFACVIPVLITENKLKPPDQIFSVASQLENEYRLNGSWKKYRELVHWKLGLLFAGVLSGGEQDSAENMETTNRFRLSFIEACEIGRRALLKNNEDEENLFGYEVIAELFERYSQDEDLKKISFIWVDSETVPGRGSALSLADAIQCYGQVALWCLEKESRPLRSQKQEAEKKLSKDSPTPKPISPSLLDAIRGSDLSSTLYHLQRKYLPEPRKTQAFISASRTGWYMVMETLLKLGASPNQEDERNRTALSYALELGDINSARVLIEKEAELNTRGLDDPEKWRRICRHAAKQGRTMIMKEMLEKWGSSLFHDEDDQGMTPLGWAITAGNAATVRVLLSDSWIGHNEYYTKPPLHLAIKEGREDMVDMLLEAGLDPNFKNDSLSTINSPPLVYAVKLGVGDRPSKESIFTRILNTKNVDVACTDGAGRTALWWAAALGLDSYVQGLLKSENVKVLNKPDHHGTTPLSIAVQAGNLGAVRLLQETELSDNNVHLRDIFIAAKNGKTSIVEELLPPRIRRKDDAARLLERHGLEEMWPTIARSRFWHRDGEYYNDNIEGGSNFDRALQEIGPLPGDQNETRVSLKLWGSGEEWLSPDVATISR
ncbi:putative ankyrin repeat protein [Durotheca rogersii]|uniref:putative ankyrin repeat protein n=1 Tax=Durotheca rogersii TaxID=419775 RepID=UPI0022208FA3|nr:putative ankyrin repeat protein [Durotheca rogersii]KAI5861325.1 putative ankyrin repeat protein [Durotheca rogersii]